MNVVFDPAELKPVIDLAVSEALHAHTASGANLADDRLAYSLEEASRLLGVLPHVLRDRKDEGELTAFRNGRRWFVSHASLIDFITRQESAASDEVMDA